MPPPASAGMCRPVRARRRSRGQGREQRHPEEITDNGKTSYEVKIIAKSGRMREIVYRANGQVTEFEEESYLSEIPPGARAAIEKVVASGELLKVNIIHRGRALLHEGEYRLEGAKKK